MCVCVCVCVKTMSATLRYCTLTYYIAWMGVRFVSFPRRVECENRVMQMDGVVWVKTKSKSRCDVTTSRVRNHPRTSAVHTGWWTWRKSLRSSPRSS